MVELLTFIGISMLLISSVFPSLISLTVETVPKSLKSPSFLVAVGAMIVFGSNALAG
jgi:hypothetical protein